MPDAEPFDPFNAEPDPKVQKEALLRSLEMAQGFALYFVVCDPGDVRTQLMQDIAAHFPEKEIQPVPVTIETGNLFHLLQTKLHNATPGTVFVYGLENWISGAVDQRSIPFILNLNAARNNFYGLVHCPLVFFIARHVLKAIVNGAPDFFSVRSGVYVFPLTPSEREARAAQSAEIGQNEILGFPVLARNDLIAETEHLLAELRSLDDKHYNPRDEALLSNQLGLAYLALGKYSEAEPLLVNSLRIQRDISNAKSPLFIAGLVNLAGLYLDQEQYDQAKQLFDEMLSLPLSGEDKKDAIIASGLSSCLNGLALISESQECYTEAETLFLEAIKIQRELATTSSADLARFLNNLAGLYEAQGRYAEAESLLVESLQMRRSSLPSGHPDIAQSSNNLAHFLEGRGRFAEAEPLYFDALQMLRANLGEQHAITKGVERNIIRFLTVKSKFSEKLMLHLNAKAPLPLNVPLTSLLSEFMPMQPRRKKKK